MQPTRRRLVVRFGLYEVDLDSGEMRKAGLKIQVQPQPLKVLESLLEHPGEVVTRDELRSRIWPSESFGDFDQAVNVAVAKLRTALGDSAENPRFIETIPRRGYRFLAEVKVDQLDRPLKTPPDIPNPAQQNVTEMEHAREQPHARPRWQHAWKFFSAAIAVALITLITWIIVPRKRPSPIVPATRAVRS